MPRKVSTHRFIRLGLLSLAGLYAFAPNLLAADRLSQALTDVQVLYLFEDPLEIDWPTLYYLNEEHGCRVDLLTLSSSHGFYYQSREVPEKGIHLHQYFLDPDDPALLDSVTTVLFRQRRPDLVILGGTDFGPLVDGMAAKLQNLPLDDSSIYSIRKLYRVADRVVSGDAVTINRPELIEKYHDRMALEIPHLYSWMTVDQIGDVRLVQYLTLKSTVPPGEPSPDFLTGVAPLRLPTVLDTLLADGTVKQSFLLRTRSFTLSFEAALKTVGKARVQHVITGYKSLLELDRQIGTEPRLRALPELRQYMDGLISRAQAAALDEIGMDWDGRIILRDSPHGPRLKFRAALGVNGPQTIELSYVRFHPYWDSAAVTLDSVSRKVEPHQSFVREYLVDIERSRLEATMPESLSFSAEIVYGVTPLVVRSAVPIWEQPDLKVEFYPDFFFVPPVAQVEVDRVVKAMNWKAVISKPLYYHGTATLNLETPRGVFAGAYRQSWDLERGRASETVRIPFSVSNLFELGIQRQTISLTVDNRVVATDTGIIRIAACQVDSKVTVGLMPDSTGLLEDILRMTGVAYQPITDRALTAGDLDAYKVILIGSGAVRDYPSFRLIKGRLEEYLRQGGSLVVFGQPTDWPEGALPVALVPSIEQLTGTMLLNRIPQARLTSQPYAISESNLLSWMDMRRRIGAAVVSPAERIYVSPSGATLLSVSRLGDGQLIFCGLPLVDMISHLNIEAIHLLANILNY
jgi:hypothetical protein